MKKQFKRIKRLFRNPFFKLLISSSFFTLGVLWLEKYWMFIGLIILTDAYLTQFVNWRFWRKRLPLGQKNKWTTEIFDSLIWALIIVFIIRTFLFEAYSIPTSSMEKSLNVGDYILVDKIAYGPRLPMTPISIPFTHNTLPLKNRPNSFLSSVHFPYRRLKGLNTINRFDVVVFNYPEGDTVIKELPDKSYYTLVRQYGREDVQQKYHTVYRPIDKRDNYIKRVIGLPADTIKIQHGIAHINGLREIPPIGLQYNYSIKWPKEQSDSLLGKLNISEYDIEYNEYNSIVTIPLTKKGYNTILDSSLIKAIVKYESIDAYEVNNQIFPFDERFSWTEDNFGSLVIPSKGMSINLDTNTLPLYFRMIETYEGKSISIKDTSIYINDTLCNSYTFKMNYYFMLGDNRHNSNDSRYWGFVPENHIIGKAVLVWLSIDKNKSFPDNIRWNKMFKFIR